ncbi:MAG TPA: hypothetical protein VHR42_06350 [Clostridia bacterium]|nr:hypothetical protein [Clostridia bacterium]
MEEKRKGKQDAQKKAEEAADAFVNGTSFGADPSGSYTGKPKDRGQIPEQDADDL